MVKMMILLTGTLIAQGRRTVTVALRQTENQMESYFSGFHLVLNRARWSPFAVSRQLLMLIVECFVSAGGSVDLVIDAHAGTALGSQDRAPVDITAIVPIPVIEQYLSEASSR